MIMMKTIEIFILTFALTLIFTPLVIQLATKIGALDIPDARKVHKQPIPRMGGLAIFISFAISILLILPVDKKILAFLVGAIILTIFGILDDIFSLNPKVKLLGQIFAAIIPVYFGIKVSYVTNPFGGLIWLGDASYILTIFWIVAIINAINLIDGLDGLASGTAAISAVFIGISALTRGNAFAFYAATALAGGTLAFLRYNFNPAKVFLGDTGSMFLGYSLGIFSVLGTAKSPTLISIFIPVLVMAIPIFDTLFAIVRRFFAGRPIFKPDKGHLHHCILELGYSKRKTVLIIYLANTLLGVIALYVNLLTFTQAALLIVAIILAITLGAQKIGVLGTNLGKEKTIINN